MTKLQISSGATGFLEETSKARAPKPQYADKRWHDSSQWDGWLDIYQEAVALRKNEPRLELFSIEIEMLKESTRKIRGVGFASWIVASVIALVFLNAFSAGVAMIGGAVVAFFLVRALSWIHHPERARGLLEINKSNWDKEVAPANDPVNRIRYLAYQIGIELKELVRRYNYLVDACNLGQATPIQQKEVRENGPVVSQLLETFEWLVAYYNWLVEGRALGNTPPIQPSVAIHLEEVLGAISGITSATAPEETTRALKESADSLRANKALVDLQRELGNLPASLLPAKP